MSGGPALAQDGYWSAYLTPPPDLTRYRPGGIVLDVGCGQGGQLAALREAGCQAVGARAGAGRGVSRHGASGHHGRAESLPVRREGCHGVLCNVVLPYTDERRAITEIARVLEKGGVAVIYLHGLGYSLRYLLRPEVWKLSIYGARTILNTMVYRVTLSSKNATSGVAVNVSCTPLHDLCVERVLRGPVSSRSTSSGPSTAWCAA